MTHPFHSTLRTGAMALAAALALSACGAMLRQPPPAGAPLAAVTAQLGQPNAAYPLPDGGRMLDYGGQPMGQFQYMAHIGPDGRLVSYGQVLTSENFAKVKVDQWTKDDILRHFGHPAEVSRVYVHDYEVWSYRYKQDGIWPAYMNIYFNGRGEVNHTGNSPDPLLDDRSKGL